MHPFHEVHIRTQAGVVGAVSQGQLDLVGGDVDAEHATSAGFQQLDRQLTDQAQANDDARFTQTHVRDTDPLQRDRAHGHEGGVV